MQGTVLKVAVELGAIVEQGAVVAIIEAMKMETEVVAHKAGKISDLPITVGGSVAPGDTIAVIAAAEG
jgi:acetyl-CoA/propionyl-CoA carboxylase biotin carboxyl carrier protein